MDKTEKATPHKREQERKRGNVFQSKDLISGVTILLSFFALRMLLSYMFGRFTSVLNECINLGSSIDEFSIFVGSNAIFTLTVNILLLALPMLLIAMALGLLMSISQTKLMFSTELLQPKFSRLNPIEGIKKMFALKSWIELIKSLIKVTVIIMIVYNVIMSKFHEMPLLMAADIYTDINWLGEAIFDVALYAGLGMLGIGVVDYFYQWWEHERNLKMSKQEIKDEMKQMEGSPETKMRISKIQRQMAQSRMMNNVKNADVVVRNPTHFAVALQYNINKNVAPVVIAKGQDYVAQKIIEEAKKYNIEMIEDKPLARALYETVELDQEIPEEFYYAVVDIIAYIYDLKNIKVADLASAPTAE